MPQRARARRSVAASMVVWIVIAFEALMPAAAVAVSTTPAVTVHLRSAAPGNALRVAAEVRWTGVATSGSASPPPATTRPRLVRRCPGRPTSQRARVTLESSPGYDFRVSPLSSSGATGVWTVSGPIRARMALETESSAAYAGTWARRVSTPFLEGATREARATDSSVRFKVRARGIAWVATRGQVAARRRSRSTVRPTRPSTCTRQRWRIGASCGQGHGRRPTRTR